MSAIHDQIWCSFRETLAASPQKWDLEHASVKDLDGFCRSMFQTYTAHHHSLRLTNLGFRVISTLYQCWKVELPENWPDIINKGSTLLAFHQKIHSPYHWDRKWFYVFHSEIAFELQMVSNDFVAWIAAF